MKKLFDIILKMMMVTAVVGLFYGCKPKQPINVLVVHQYDQGQLTYEEYDRTIVDELCDAGYDPHIVNWYLQLEDQAHMDCHQSLVDLNDSLTQLNWVPDLILAEGDRTLSQWHLQQNENLPTWRDSVITVFGGVRFYDLPVIDKLQKTIIIHDQLNMYRNLDFISKLTGSRNIEIELDNYHEDSLIYLQINQQLGEQPYAMFMDSLGHVSGNQKPVIHYNDSMSIYFYSAEWSEVETKEQVAITDSSYTQLTDVTSLPNRQDIIDDMYRNSWRYPVLVPKKDVWCEAIASKTYRPQFTTCRELFNDGKGSYLCGYFTSYETMARDMVKAALDALNVRGVRHDVMHEPNAYMDYMAMERLGLKYNDYNEEFIIKNVPMKVSNPLLYSMVTIGYFLGIAFLVGAIVFIWLKSHKDSLRNLAANLEEEREMNQLAIDASGNFYISNLKGMQRVLDSMGPEQERCKEDIKASLSEMGTHTHSYRIRAAMDEEKNMAWWSLRYVVNYNTETGFDIKGYLLNVNEDVNFTNEMQQIQKIAEETKRTEGFLWTMAHEIRTPLNTIVGFCDVMKMMGSEMSEQERNQMAHDVNDNNLLLRRIVENMDNYSCAVSHEIVFERKDVSVDRLMHDLYAENCSRFEAKGLDFVLVQGRMGAVVSADYRRMKEAMNQLIDNALKFTTNGTVALGWQYDLTAGVIELFVEDSGLGIQEDDLPLVFDMFWKRDSFKPGVGIGLSLVKVYMEAMGGEIRVKSEQGIGSRMSLLFSGGLAGSPKFSS